MRHLPRPSVAPEAFPSWPSRPSLRPSAENLAADLARALRLQEREAKARGYDALFPEGWPDFWLDPTLNAWAHGREEYRDAADERVLELHLTGYATEADFRRAWSSRLAQRKRAARLKAEKAAWTPEQKAAAAAAKELSRLLGRVVQARRALANAKARPDWTEWMGYGYVSNVKAAEVALEGYLKDCPEQREAVAEELARRMAKAPRKRAA